MLQPRLNNCIDCASISSLLSEIDCKIKELAQNQYNNIKFVLNRKVPHSVFKDLLNYKRILTYKNINPEYASLYTIDSIASKVKLLIYK